MSWTSVSIPDLTGRLAVVTGANGGLGLETAKALAAHGARVVMAVRNRIKAEDAVAGLRAGIPSADLVLVDLDLGSLATVRSAAEEILARADRIDILVNNAGVMATAEGRTADGFEQQLGINHLGHWALTAQLMPALLAAPAARVVSVTSTAHLMGRPLDPDNPHLHGCYDPWRAYGQSKLANYHFAIGLQRAFDLAGVRTQSVLAHPGLTNTDLQATAVTSGGGGSVGRFFERLTPRVGMSPARGALPQLRAATDPAAHGGEFYAPRFVNNGPPVRRSFLRPGADTAIAVLWRVSERETGIPMLIR